MISYEYPLNERIRTLLRLEDLFLKIAHFTAGAAPQDHHVALLTIFETLEVARASSSIWYPARSPAAPTSRSTWCRNLNASVRS